MNTRLNHRTLASFALLCSFSAWSQSNSSFTNFSLGALETFKKYVQTDVFYTHDYISNTGGVKSGPRNIGALDLYFESDFSKFSNVPGQVQLHYIHINQNDQRGAIGDAQAASNIDVPVQVDRIVDFWYQHEFSEKFKGLIGIQDISMEYGITESSLNFLNSSFGVTADFTYSGVNGPSIYPITSVGARGLYNFTEELSLRAGIYDADPGDPTTYRSFHTRIGGSSGFLEIAEIAYQDDDQKIGLGAWNYSKKQEKIGTDEKAALYGSNVFLEKKITHGLKTFFRFGWANPVANEIQSNTVLGMAYTGIFQRKKVNDEAGLGATQIHFSRQFIKEESSGGDYSSEETAYEAYYQFKPIKHLSLRPDVQYITNPAGSRDVKNAWAMGFRTVVDI